MGTDVHMNTQPPNVPIDVSVFHMSMQIHKPKGEQCCTEVLGCTTGNRFEKHLGLTHSELNLVYHIFRNLVDMPTFSYKSMEGHYLQFQKLCPLLVNIFMNTYIDQPPATVTEHFIESKLK